jgi:hypothetical protein
MLSTMSDVMTSRRFVEPADRRSGWWRFLRSLRKDGDHPTTGLTPPPITRRGASVPNHARLSLAQLLWRISNPSEAISQGKTRSSGAHANNANA